MIGLNRLIHDLTQALLNMTLKKELCQEPAQGLYYYSHSFTAPQGGRSGFDSRCCRWEFFSDMILPAEHGPCVRLILYQK